MSSLLKALKQQQSPLTRRGSQLDPQLLDRQSSVSGRWLLQLLLVVGGVLVVVFAVLLWQSLMVLQPQPQPAKQSTPASNYSFGTAVPVKAVNWPAEPETPSPQPGATEQPEPIVVNPQLQQPDQTQASNREPFNLDSVSEDLLAKFEQAVKDSSTTEENSPAESVLPALPQLAERFRRQVPQFSYDGHMFVSERADRWIELSGQRLYVGDNFQGLLVERIDPQQVVLSLQGKAFTVEALSDWRQP